MKPILFKAELVRKILDGEKTTIRCIIKPQLIQTAKLEIGFNVLKKAKYSRGDVLYVREQWAHVRDSDRNIVTVYKTDKPTGKMKPPKWFPSIHMPKEAARLYITIIDVRAERLNDITELGAEAEGFRAKPARYNLPATSARDEFIEFWKKTFTAAGETWDDNPFVFVYEFAVKNIKK